MPKMLFKPLGMLVGVLGGLLANAAFSAIWKRVTGEADAPDPADRDRSWREVLIAATVQGAIFGLVKAAVDRGMATGVSNVTGEWPGDKKSK